MYDGRLGEFPVHISDIWHPGQIKQEKPVVPDTAAAPRERKGRAPLVGSRLETAEGNNSVEERGLGKLEFSDLHIERAMPIPSISTFFWPLYR